MRAGQHDFDPFAQTRCPAGVAHRRRAPHGKDGAAHSGRDVERLPAATIRPGLSSAAWMRSMGQNRPRLRRPRRPTRRRAAQRRPGGGDPAGPHRRGRAALAASVRRDQGAGGGAVCDDRILALNKRGHTACRPRARRSACCARRDSKSTRIGCRTCLERTRSATGRISPGCGRRCESAAGRIENLPHLTRAQQ